MNYLNLFASLALLLAMIVATSVEAGEKKDIIVILPKKKKSYDYGHSYGSYDMGSYHGGYAPSAYSGYDSYSPSGYGYEQHGYEHNNYDTGHNQYDGMSEYGEYGHK